MDRWATPSVEAWFAPLRGGGDPLFCVCTSRRRNGIPASFEQGRQPCGPGCMAGRIVKRQRAAAKGFSKTFAAARSIIRVARAINQATRAIVGAVRLIVCAARSIVGMACPRNRLRIRRVPLLPRTRIRAGRPCCFPCGTVLIYISPPTSAPIPHRADRWQRPCRRDQ